MLSCISIKHEKWKTYYNRKKKGKISWWHSPITKRLFSQESLSETQDLETWWGQSEEYKVLTGGKSSFSPLGHSEWCQPNVQVTPQNSPFFYKRVNLNSLVIGIQGEVLVLNLYNIPIAKFHLFRLKTIFSISSLNKQQHLLM